MDQETAIKALLIDDEEPFLDVLQKRLKKRGIDVQTANSGTKGLELLNTMSFNIVVMDVCMPGMDGLDTLKQIKQQWPITEVILLTGHACLESARRGMDYGAFDYMMKPVDITKLVYRLEDAYDKVRVLTTKSNFNKGGD